MSEYRCGHCKTVTPEPREASGELRCTNCGYKIFFKVRQPIAKPVKAV
jgi:DNA-directed RNA polymerase subunit RPC12/RpoP